MNAIRPGTLVLLASLSVLFACEAPTDARIASVTLTAGSPEAFAHLLGEHGTIRMRLRTLAQRAPGFTGVFLDENGELTVTVAKDDFTEESLDNVVSWARSYSAATLGQATAKIRHVKYDYALLDDRYHDVETAIVPDGNVLSTAIDEIRGIIIVGVRNLSRTDELRARLLALGVPPDMVELEERPQAVVSTTLNQRFRPMIGGLQIWEYSGHTCTLGFDVMRWDTGYDAYSSPIYFFTAGHCSANWGVQTGFAWWQVGYPASDVVGAEFEIVPKRSAPNCPLNKSPCIDADVLVVRYNDNMTFPDSVSYGRVANVNSAKTIITPYYSVQGISMGGLNGQTITMVGQVSGKKTGTISRICEDQLVTNPSGGTIWVLCQDRANYTAMTGDSGAPLFIPYAPGNPHTPTIVGVHSNVASNGYKWFSSISAIDYALNSAYFIW